MNIQIYNFLIKISIFLCSILGGLHFLRIGEINYSLIYITSAFLIFSKYHLKYLIVLILLLLSLLMWFNTTYDLVIFRKIAGLPYKRLIIIMSGVIIFNLLNIYLIVSTKDLFHILKDNFFSLSIFLMTFGLVFFLRNKMSIKILLLDRFGLSIGIYEAFLLGIYGSIIGYRLKDHRSHYKLRQKIWLLFSLVFFSQLFLGLFVSKEFLMTGKLHFPIPALVIGGPIYRGSGFFMIGLFLSTILLVGPAWCSHLCYVGGLDAATSSIFKQIKYISLTRKIAWINLFLTVILALIFRWLHTPINYIITVVSFFGIISLIFIFVVSPFLSKMSHCLMLCPLGIASILLGKINPFRIKINKDKCTSCGVCVKKCKYQAIELKDKIHINRYCTLCGDCVAVCHNHVFYYAFLSKGNKYIYHIYIFLITVIHTIFLGFARI